MICKFEWLRYMCAMGSGRTAANGTIARPWADCRPDQTGPAVLGVDRHLATHIHGDVTGSEGPSPQLPARTTTTLGRTRRHAEPRWVGRSFRHLSVFYTVMSKGAL